MKEGKLFIIKEGLSEDKNIRKTVLVYQHDQIEDEVLFVVVDKSLPDKYYEPISGFVELFDIKDGNK